MFRTLRMSFVITAFTAISVTFLTSLAEEAEPGRAPRRRVEEVRPPVGAGAVRIIDLGRQTRQPTKIVLPVQVSRARA